MTIVMIELKCKKSKLSGYDVVLILGDSHREPSSVIKNTVYVDIVTGFIGIIFVHFIFTNLCTCISVNINANTLKY